MRLNTQATEQEGRKMSERTDYPAGVPCWVDTLQADPEAAMHFYGELFGWQFDGPGPMSDGAGYYVARLRGRDVAGIGRLPDGVGATAWNTVIAVGSVEAATSRVLDCGGELLLPPTDADPAGRTAVARDPGGASFCLWEAQDRQGAQLVNEPSAWAMSALQTADPERTAAFYRELFGWDAQSVALGDMEVTLLRLPGYVGGEPGQPVPRDVVAVMTPTDEDGAAPDAWTVDFWIDDAARAAATASDLGGQVLVEPFEVAGFTRAVLADPSGAAFSVSQLHVDR